MQHYLSQLKNGGVIYRVGNDAHLVQGSTSTYQLALEAIAAQISLIACIERHGLGASVDLTALAAQGELDCPLRHPDPAHTFLTGTGLTHLGSASTRDAMHAKIDGMSDSMKMFRMGLEGGKPNADAVGVQPEWFYKGSGVNLVASGEPLVSPAFALDAGEEPEIAGWYVNGADGTPYRVGFSLANEFSDHVTERINYLFLAHSKLRPLAVGAELLLGELPTDIRGTSRIMRAGQVAWEKAFLSGEDNMSHHIANLEYHHFKYPLFRQAHDVHVHCFGTATLSFADGFKAQNGDVFEISANAWSLPLANPLQLAAPCAKEIKIL